MLELANAIAHFVRQASAGSDVQPKVTVSRLKRQDARVSVGGAITIDVEWFKGGARVGNRRMYRDNVTKQFDMGEVMERVTEILKNHAESVKRHAEAKSKEEEILHLKDAARADPRLSVERRTWSQEDSVAITFKTPDLIAASIVIDWLKEFSYDGSDTTPAPRANVADAVYQLDWKNYTLRQLASLAFTDEEWKAICAMPSGMNHERYEQTHLGQVYRIK